MFGVTMYILKENSRRAGREVNYKMLSVSIALLVCSTVVRTSHTFTQVSMTYILS